MSTGKTLEEAIVDLSKKAVTAFKPIANSYIKEIETFKKAFITPAMIVCMKYPRVVYLAECHPKARVRKKNKHRIEKLIKKESAKHEIPKETSCD